MPTAIRLVPYDPDWPGRFAEEYRVLAAIFSGVEAVIEHIGSTAVPGLAAKPVIDIMVGLTTLTDAEDRIGLLRSAGYQYGAEHETDIPERRYFRKPIAPPRTHHLHCVVHGSRDWLRNLAFRDTLRQRPSVAAEYSALKAALALSVGKAEYTRRKTPFIESVLAKERGSSAS